jgi:hypothetical protein
MSRAGGDDPFAALGLPARTGLSDDDVRAAWRRIAAATHPDRPDGGDLARFAAAAAAYTVLRTRSGRGEALADLADRAGGPARPRGGRRASQAAGVPPGGPPDGARADGRLRARPAARWPDPAAPEPGAPEPGAPEPGAPDPAATARPGPPGAAPGLPPLAGRGRLAGTGLLTRIRRGRPAMLALRVVIAAAVSAGAAVVAGAQPAVPALAVGAATWLLLTARNDLAPPR